VIERGKAVRIHAFKQSHRILMPGPPQVVSKLAKRNEARRHVRQHGKRTQALFGHGQPRWPAYCWLRKSIIWRSRPSFFLLKWKVRRGKWAMCASPDSAG